MEIFLLVCANRMSKNVGISANWRFLCVQFQVTFSFAKIFVTALLKELLTEKKTPLITERIDLDKSRR